MKTLYITRYCFDRYGESQDLDGGGVSLGSHSSADAVKLMLAGQAGNKFSKGVYQNNRFAGIFSLTLLQSDFL